jgi:hypothetical protein
MRMRRFLQFVGELTMHRHSLWLVSRRWLLPGN